MNRIRGLALVLVAGAVLATTSAARAERTTTLRSSGQRNTGARSDITVPYLTSGRSAFISGSVAPRIYASPQVDDRANPQAKPVYNIIFYGAQQGFGDRSNGATPRSR
jgi:hypothetical protein